MHVIRNEECALFRDDCRFIRVSKTTNTPITAVANLLLENITSNVAIQKPNGWS
jgi:hypothetical protein